MIILTCHPIMPRRASFSREQKLVVVGGGGERLWGEAPVVTIAERPGGVGKSAITIRFVTSQFYDQWVR